MIQKLSNNTEIMILKQEKGGDVIILNKKKDTEKCCDILNTDQFKTFEKSAHKRLN